MFIEQYYQQEQQQVTFTRQQGSDFAKNIADDFNPLHDVEAKRFCIPGDLLFSLVLSKYGVSQHMAFTFSGMVTEDVKLNLPSADNQLAISGDNGKEYLSISRSGNNQLNEQFIDNLTKQYVSFSGQTFPHILVPLLQEKSVMINPDRPMVIYESMLIDLQRLDLTTVELELDKERTQLETSGKRGKLCLTFKLTTEGEIVGRGEKHMILSGLKPYDQSAVDRLISNYNQGKVAHKQ
ncbi:MAG: hypothetical protein ACJA0N_000874 [Pseudohongiellaceae bacterium]|jgi:hypothetical protein